MLIACPNCSTRYNIDPNIVGVGGRKVRCSQCGNVWIQRLPDRENASDVDIDMAASGRGGIDMDEDDFGQEALQEALPPPCQSRPQRQEAPARPPKQATRSHPHEDFDEGEDAADSRGRRMRVPVFWLVAAAVLLGTGVLGLLFRDTISENAASIVGIFQDDRPLGELWQVRPKRVQEDPANPNRLIVAGEVYNTSDEDLEIPRMLAIIRGRDDIELKKWEFTANNVIVLGGDRTTFRTSFTRVEGGEKIEITFVDE